MSSAFKWSKMNAQITFRIEVPMPRPWNSRPSHEPVSPTRVMRNSLVLNPWDPTSWPSKRTARSMPHFAGEKLARCPQWNCAVFLGISSGGAIDQGVLNGIRSGAWMPLIARSASGPSRSSVIPRSSTGPAVIRRPSRGSAVAAVVIVSSSLSRVPVIGAYLTTDGHGPATGFRARGRGTSARDSDRRGQVADPDGGGCPIGAGVDSGDRVGADVDDVQRARGRCRRTGQQGQRGRPASDDNRRPGRVEERDRPVRADPDLPRDLERGRLESDQ